MIDLIGLQYRWGANPSDGHGFTDCWQLVCEVRSRLGLANYRDKFNWVYQQRQEGSVLVLHVLRWLYRDATRVDQPDLGSIACFNGNKSRAVLGVCHSPHQILLIGPAGRSVSAPCSMIQAVRYFNA